MSIFYHSVGGWQGIAEHGAQITEHESRSMGHKARSTDHGTRNMNHEAWGTKQLRKTRDSHET
jgi:hypothetical protein